MLHSWRRLSSLRVYGTFESRVAAVQLVTGKSPEPADKNVGVIALCIGCTRINFRVRVASKITVKYGPPHFG